MIPSVTYGLNPFTEKWAKIVQEKIMSNTEKIVWGTSDKDKLRELQEKLQKEFDASYALRSTDNQWDLPYSMGVEFALKLVKEITGINTTHSPF